MKLLSQDYAWSHLTALTYQYETQPLAPWTAWYVHQLPLWFHQLSCLFVLGVELIIPWFVFGPRVLRHIAGICIITLQLLIIATGIYGFFNLLTIALCLFLFDDAARPPSTSRSVSQPSAPRAVTIPVAITLGAASFMTFWQTVFAPLSFDFTPVRQIQVLSRAFRITNGYGLFAVMTTSRPEIIIEGSNDGSHWQAYEFRSKAGDIHRRPPWFIGHMPRVDWQMWFAALGRYQENPWFLSLCQRVLEGSPPVLSLLAKNPFPNTPPKHLRAIVYEYHFSTPTQRRATGAWWTRTQQGLYCPVLELRHHKEE